MLAGPIIGYLVSREERRRSRERAAIEVEGKARRTFNPGSRVLLEGPQPTKAAKGVTALPHGSGSSVNTVHSNGTTQVVADMTKITTLADGSVVITDPQGTTTVVIPAGSGTVQERAQQEIQALVQHASPQGGNQPTPEEIGELAGSIVDVIVASYGAQRGARTLWRNTGRKLVLRRQTEDLLRQTWAAGGGEDEAALGPQGLDDLTPPGDMWRAYAQSGGEIPPGEEWRAQMARAPRVGPTVDLDYEPPGIDLFDGIGYDTNRYNSQYTIGPYPDGVGPSDASDPSIWQVIEPDELPTLTGGLDAPLPEEPPPGWLGEWPPPSSEIPVALQRLLFTAATVNATSGGGSRASGFFNPDAPNNLDELLADPLANPEYQDYVASQLSGPQSVEELVSEHVDTLHGYAANEQAPLRQSAQPSFLHAVDANGNVAPTRGPGLSRGAGAAATVGRLGAGGVAFTLGSRLGDGDVGQTTAYTTAIQTAGSAAVDMAAHAVDGQLTAQTARQIMVGKAAVRGAAGEVLALPTLGVLGEIPGVAAGTALYMVTQRPFEDAARNLTGNENVAKIAAPAASGMVSGLGSAAVGGLLVSGGDLALLEASLVAGGPATMLAGAALGAGFGIYRVLNDKPPARFSATSVRQLDERWVNHQVVQGNLTQRQADALLMDGEREMKRERHVLHESDSGGGGFNNPGLLYDLEDMALGVNILGYNENTFLGMSTGNTAVTQSQSSDVARLLGPLDPSVVADYRQHVLNTDAYRRAYAWEAEHPYNQLTQEMRDDLQRHAWDTAMYNMQIDPGTQRPFPEDHVYHVTPDMMRREANRQLVRDYVTYANLDPIWYDHNQIPQYSSDQWLNYAADQPGVNFWMTDNNGVSALRRMRDGTTWNDVMRQMSTN